MLGAKISHAEFALNWAPDIANRAASQGLSFAVCNFPGYANQGNCGSFVPGNEGTTTPFVNELVTDGIKTYYHLIVGDPNSNFAQEIYVGTGTVTYQDGKPTSATLGQTGGNAGCFPGSPFYTGVAACGNAYNKLGVDANVTGNGSANPTVVQMQQFVKDPASGFTLEFVKSSFAQKPKITQSIVNSEINAQFVMDMSGTNYNTNTTAAVVTNTIDIIDPAIKGDFDMATDIQSSTVTGGRFTFTPAPLGNGYGGAGGTYNYIDGGFNLNAIDWQQLKN